MNGVIFSRFHCIALIRLLGALAALSIPAYAQTDSGVRSITLFRYTQPVLRDLMLPFDGPGSSPRNPARLADGERFFGQFGARAAGDSRATDISLGGGFFRRFYLGAYLAGAGGKFDFTNARILDNRFGLQTAIRLPSDPEGKGHLSIGLAYVLLDINLMDRYKISRASPDLGLVWVPAAHPGRWELEFGASFRDLRAVEGTVPVPDSAPGTGGSVHVDFAPGLATGSFRLSAPGRTWTVFAEAAAGNDYRRYPGDLRLFGWKAGGSRLYVPRAGLTFRPLPPLSLGLERDWGRYWVLSAKSEGSGFLPRTIHCEGEFRSAYGPYLQYERPDRTGWTFSWNLGIRF